MGIAVPGICGGYLCGQNLAGTWRTTWDRPTEILNARTFSVTKFDGPAISLTVNRPVLFLNAKGYAKQTSSVMNFGRPILTLKSGVFFIGPFLRVELAGVPRLYLRGRAVLLAVSSSPAFRRPVLYLIARPLTRVGRAGLSPTIPVSETLSPAACRPATLVATASSSRTLIATATGTRTLDPTECVEDDGDLLVPSPTVVR